MKRNLYPLLSYPPLISFNLFFSTTTAAYLVRPFKLKATTHWNWTSPLNLRENSNLIEKASLWLTLELDGKVFFFFLIKLHCFTVTLSPTGSPDSCKFAYSFLSLSLSLSLSLISFSWSGLLFYFIIIILFLKFSFFTLSYHSPRQDFYRFDSFEITSPTRVLFTLQLVFKSKSNTLRLGLSFPLLVICHIKIVKYINKKKYNSWNW